MRQSIILIRCEIQIPYTRKQMGSASAAEKHHDAIKTAMMAFAAIHCTYKDVCTLLSASP